MHLSGWGTNRFPSHHFFSSARTSVSVFLNASVVSETQYTVVSSVYNYVSPERTALERSFVKSEKKIGPRTDRIRFEVLLSFCSNIVCYTVSKASVESTKSISKRSFVSSATLHFSIMCIKSCSVDFPVM